jgi:hypothetical protein
MLSLKVYLETNWGWYSSAYRNLRNQQDSKPYIPGFVIDVLALFIYKHFDLIAEDGCPASSGFLFSPSKTIAIHNIAKIPPKSRYSDISPAQCLCISSVPS